MGNSFSLLIFQPCKNDTFPAELAWSRCTGECLGGGSWMKQCNRCRCFGGRGAACTRKLCRESITIALTSSQGYEWNWLILHLLSRKRIPSLLLIVNNYLCLFSWVPTGPSSCSKLDRAKCPEYRMIDYMLVKGCRPVYPAISPLHGCCAKYFECDSKFW